MATGVHFGQMLKKIIAKHNYKRLDITNAMGTAAPSLYTYEEKPSIQFSIVLRLCHAMKYNFLLDIAAAMPADYKYDGSRMAAHQEKILALEEENKKLKWENDLLKEMIIKRG